VVRDATVLTTRDAVVLSMIAEGPTYGYAIETELLRRDVRDWADLSKPQIYKSIEKLLGLGYVADAAPVVASRGPGPTVIAITKAGKAGLLRALREDRWSLARERPLFSTWLALCSTLAPADIDRGVRTRRAFVRSELARERKTLLAIRSDPTVKSSYPSAMVSFIIRQFEVEATWLDELHRTITAASRP
jgi:DNA-binding PadR family transcriptional regulator